MATIAALVGQSVVRKIISILGRASLIIFVLAFTIFVSAISLGMLSFQLYKPLNFKLFGSINAYFHSCQTGGEGIANMIEKIERKEYMGIENLCS